MFLNYFMVGFGDFWIRFIDIFATCVSVAAFNGLDK